MKHPDVLLCDLDAFYASVEQLDRPELKGKPVIVGGSPEGRGVVSTCSYEARKFGVRSAMPMRKAIELCPDAVILPVNMKRYKELSNQVLEIFERHTPDIEPVSIDEAYLGVKTGEGENTARSIRAAVKKELALPISIGISINKLLAKIACEQAKPDNLQTFWFDEVPKRLWPMPVRVLPGIGPETEKKLARYGIKTVGDLAEFPDDALTGLLGKNGLVLKKYAIGQDDRKIETDYERKSISEEATFPQDVFDRDRILTTLLELSEEVGYRLRSSGFRAKTISMKLRFADFTTITRDITLSEAADSDQEIYHTVEKLFHRHSGKPPWRLVGLKASGLEGSKQLSLFSPASESEEKITLVKDRLRDKYGREILVSAKRLMRPK